MSNLLSSLIYFSVNNQVLIPIPADFISNFIQCNILNFGYLYKKQPYIYVFVSIIHIWSQTVKKLIFFNK